MLRSVAFVLALALSPRFTEFRLSAQAVSAARPDGRETAVRLAAERCSPLSAAQKKWLNDTWSPYERFLMACPVRIGSGSPSLVVITVDDYAVERSLADDAPAPKLPRPLVCSPSGSVLGTLPYAFPLDSPLTLDVTFKNWVNNMPTVIELFLNDPAVGGNKKLPPMKWDDKLKKYLPTKPAAN